MAFTRTFAPAIKTMLGLLLGLFVLHPLGAEGNPLPAPVASALRDAGITPQSAAIVIQSVDGGPPLIRHNADRAMNPASAMKLLTTYAALEILGPAYAWQTTALADTAPIDGTLSGNLYLRGSGDPRLGLEEFWLLLRQLRARGVRDIQGDLVLDRSAFSVPAHDPAEFDGKPLRPYNAGPDALLINLNSLSLTLAPASEQKNVRIFVDTPADEARIVNRLKLGDEACGDWREKILTGVEQGVLVLSGVFPASCGEKRLHLAPWAANDQVGQLFRALWQELGGSLHGSVRDGNAPAQALTLATHESPPLAAIVRDINKYSNNVMARQVFLTLAGERPATGAQSTRRIRAWLNAKSLKLAELVMDNGSGLSRHERISADSLSRLLIAAWNSPVMPELMSSLPVAGVDGTLKKRLGQSASAGRAHLKTGYLEGVRALAGYVQDSHGRRWVLVFLINSPKAGQGKPAMDALLEWLSER